MQKKNREKKVRKDYLKPEVEKHENLKDITLLSFSPPQTTYDIDKGQLTILKYKKDS